MKKFVLLFSIVILCFSLQSSAFARESILQMNVRAVVSSDTVLTVTEQIDFVAEGKEIRRGLVRVIPTTGRRDGRRVAARFALKSATLDGRPVPYELQKAGNAMEVALGDDTFLKHGKHTYVLTYTISDQLAFHNDGDELYWNATGNNWIFPIEKATFRVELPKGASIFEFDGWTGPRGAKEKNWHGGKNGVFHTTRPLAPGEGFTVTATWTKGFMIEPPKSPFWAFMNRWKSSLFWLLVFSVFAWYGGWWFAVGKDPRRGVVIPIFSPPAGFEPAFVRYVKKLEFDSEALLADLIDLAIRGFIVLKPSGRSLAVSATSKERESELSAPHRTLLSLLFADGRTSVLLGDGAGVGDPYAAYLVQRATGALPSIYGFGKKQVGSVPKRPALILKNRWVILSGLLLFVPMLWLMSLMEDIFSARMLAALPLLFLLVWIAGFASSMISALRRKKRRSTEDAPFAALFDRISRIVRTIVLIAACVLFVPFSYVFGQTSGLFSDLNYPVWGGFVAAVAAAAFFSFLMPRRTVVGRLLLDQVEGLEMYLKTAEKQRLEALYPAVQGKIPELTPELFERLLPYAFALEVAETWIDSCASLLATQEYRPAWYHSSGSFSVDRFRNSIGSLSDSVRTASHSSGGGSSGRGGGGSSGGGGGGGGRGR